ncbi:MAG TPA: hypothetical protein DCO78_01205, partial [Chitinophagaceae bacterium]|nr:hypothetical protein [Chitinophagaceae bacterium]
MLQRLQTVWLLLA